MSLLITQSVSLRLILMMMFLSLAACGGGDSGNNAGTLSYSGVTSAAVIDLDNAHDLAIDAYVNGKSGGILGHALAVHQAGEYQQQPRTLLLGTLLHTIALNLQNVQIEPTNSHLIALHYTDTESGECGGNRQYAIEVDQGSGDFFGHVDFNAYCEDDITINGKLDISGSFDSQADHFGQIEFNLDSLIISTPHDSFSVQGSLIYNLSALPFNMNMNIFMQDNASGDIYWAKDYVMTIDSGNNARRFGHYLEAFLTGRFYNPHLGYVEITTRVPFRTYFSHRWPLSGEMVITAVNASGGVATVTLTSLSASSYKVDIDLDNDNSSDSTITGNWEDA